MRDGESEGNPYHFVTAEAFRAMVAAGELIEWGEKDGACYGTKLCGTVARISA